MVHTADKKKERTSPFSVEAQSSLCPRSLDRRIWEMKAKLMKVLHVFGLDVLLLGLLEKLVASLTKKHYSLKMAMECFVCCHVTATNEETNSVIA